MGRPVRRAGWCSALLLGVVGSVVGVRPAAADTVSYRPPVDAPVADRFRAPANRYAAGNRGIEYATPTGTRVQAAADGEVIFAGPVAGTLHVTVLHADGLRTSYSFLDRVDVARGRHVRQGDVVGEASARTHFGVRDVGGEYLDPQLLFDGSLRMRVRLVPGIEEGAPPLVATERRALLRLVLDRGVDLARTSRMDVLAHYAVELRLDLRTARIVQRLAEQADAPCSPAGDVPSVPSGRVAVLVGGLGSTSTQAAVDRLDVTALGFEQPDVVRFSYAGGRVPDASDHVQYLAIAAHEYEARDTTGDLDAAAARLVDLLEAMAAARPGVPIDVIGHSLGGVVARLALAEASARGRLPAEVATLVTLGSPHAGTDLATAAVALDGRVGPATPRVLEALIGIPPESPAVRQLAETDPPNRHAAHPLPSRIRRVSIAARGDLVVPAPNTIDPELPTAVVSVTGPHAHDALPGSPAATREIALAIAGRPPSCRSTADQLADAISGESISWASDALAAGALARRAGP